MTEECRVGRPRDKATRLADHKPLNRYHSQDHAQTDTTARCFHGPEQDNKTETCSQWAAIGIRGKRKLSAIGDAETRPGHGQVSELPTGHSLANPSSGDW